MWVAGQPLTASLQASHWNGRGAKCWTHWTAAMDHRCHPTEPQRCDLDVTRDLVRAKAASCALKLSFATYVAVVLLVVLVEYPNANQMSCKPKGSLTASQRGLTIAV